MNRITLLCGTILLFLFNSAKANQSEIFIIPEPVSINLGSGYFKLPNKIGISVPELDELDVLKDFLNQRINTTESTVIFSTQKVRNPHITFELNKNYNLELGNESHKLTVTKKNIQVQANKPARLFYGMQTLV